MKDSKPEPLPFKTSPCSEQRDGIGGTKNAFLLLPLLEPVVHMELSMVLQPKLPCFASPCLMDIDLRGRSGYKLREWELYTDSEPLQNANQIQAREITGNNTHSSYCPPILAPHDYLILFSLP